MGTPRRPRPAVGCRARNVVTDMNDAVFDQDARPQHRANRRRLSDHVLIAFHFAGDQREFEAADQLLAILELMLRRPLPEGHLERRVDAPRSLQRTSGYGYCAIPKLATFRGSSQNAPNPSHNQSTKVQAAVVLDRPEHRWDSRVDGVGSGREGRSVEGGGDGNGRRPSRHPDSECRLGSKRRLRADWRCR
jgi:hypothetical protein